MIDRTRLPDAVMVSFYHTPCSSRWEYEGLLSADGPGCAAGEGEGQCAVASPPA